MVAAVFNLILFSIGICRLSLFNQKHNVGWFLLKRFVDLFRVRYISRSHSNTFLLINQKCQIFDSLDILISAEVSLILRKLSFIKKLTWKIDEEWRVLLPRVTETASRKRTDSSCVFTRNGSVRKCGER